MVPSMPLVGAWSLEARWLFKFWWKDYMFWYDQVRKLTSSTQIIRNTYRSLKYFVLISNQHCIKRCIVSILIYVYQNYFDLLSALDRKIQCQHQRLGGGWTNAWIQVHSISVQNAGNINTITNINSTFEFLRYTRLLFVKSVMFCTVGERCCLIACRRHDRTLFLADPLQSVVKPKNLCNDNDNK